jgi:DNA-nicking Smr family endonuclease
MNSDDEDLWQRVADTAEPLQKGKNRFINLPDPVEGPERKDLKLESTPPSTAPYQGEAPPKAPSKPPVASFDRREARRLGAGRLSVDARIDLHGMRQREAYGSLKAFLARAQGQGHKHVLVITGKGGKRDQDGSFERGVLNREVPRWLSEPDFRAWVVSFTSASKRHGGEGALYVRLRRSK